LLSTIIIAENSKTKQFYFVSGMGSRTPHSRPRPDKFEARPKPDRFEARPRPKLM
jgi:hypothetical protein